MHTPSPEVSTRSHGRRRTPHSVPVAQPAVGRSRSRWWRPPWIVGLVILLVAGCGTTPAPAPGPAIDAGSMGRQAQEASTLDGSYRIYFDWSLNEPGMRLSGRGVARVEGPFRARLDLFLGNGERVAAAALVDDDLRIPSGMGDFVPPATLLWGSLGVFRPGPGTAPMEATRSDGGHASIRYRVAGGGELSYILLDRWVERMERVSAQGVREDLRLTRDRGERFPREAVYRHHGATRELRLTLESVEYVEAFPSDVWNPGH